MIISFALFGAYEISLLLMCMAFASWVHFKIEPSRKVTSLPLLITVSAKICVGFFIPFVTTLLHFNDLKTYYLIILTTWVSIIFIYAINSDYIKLVPSIINRFLQKKENLLLLSIFLLFAPLLFMSLGPPRDGDSLWIINNVYDWSQNIRSPYDPMFSGTMWEIGYLPSTLLTQSDYFWPWINLQALFVISLASITLARILGINPLLATISTTSSLSVYYFWFFPGPFSLKCDFGLTSGLLLFALGLILVTQQKKDAESFLLISIGSALMFTKLNGPFLLAGELLIFALFSYSQKTITMKNMVSIILWICLISIPLVGHVYLYNLFVHGNPLYPIAMDFWHAAAPGGAGATRTFAGTSIMSNLDNPMVWTWWFGTHNRHLPVGPLLPYTVLALFGLCFYALIQYKRTKVFPIWTLLAFYTVITWILYFNTSLTASMPQPKGTFTPIIQLRSLRYNLGGIILVELLITCLLIRKGILKDALAYIFVLINLLSRIYLLYFYIPTAHFGVLNYPNAPTEIYIGGSILLALAFMLIFLLPRSIKGWFSLAMIIALVASSPFIFEKNRHLMGDRWIPISNELAEKPRATVFLLSDLGNTEETPSTKDIPQLPFVYAAVGNHFQHLVATGRPSELSSRCRSGDAPNYVGIISPPPLGLHPKISEDASILLSELGYYKLDQNKWSAIYKLRTLR